MHRVLWLILWVASMLSIADIPSGIEFRIPSFLQMLYILCVGAFKGTVLMGVFLLIRKRWRWVFYAGLVPYIMAATVNFACFHFFGFGITRRMISIVLQTNPAEAVEFLRYSGGLLLSALLSWKFLFAVVAGVGGCILIRKVPWRVLKIPVVSASGLGLIMAIIFAVNFSSGRTAHLLSLRILKYGHETYKDLREFERLKDELGPLPDAESVSSDHRAATVVVVIGESASCGHWQAYGYPLSTTPNISAMADSLYILNDVIGSSTGTSLNLENILTLKSDDSPEGEVLKFPRVIDIFNEASYRTYWLSNQERTGLVSNMSGVLASKACVVRYIGAESSEDALITRYDDELLPYLNEALADSAAYKIIFLHLLGSHVVYTSRYPASAEVFTAEDVLKLPGKKSLSEDEAATVAQYDNSIRYTDSVLGKMVEAVSRQSEPAVLVYFSDHGVNVYDSDGIHGRSERYVEVPAVVYLNKAFRTSYPELDSVFTKAIDLPITTANIAHPLMNLTGTSYSGYDSTRDFLSPNYHLRPRHVDHHPWQFE